MEDFNGIEIKEGDRLTFDWFYEDDLINKMRKRFPNRFGECTDKEIIERIHQPTYTAKINEKGICFGEGIKVNEYGKRLYIHDFRLKYTKIVSEAQC